MSAETKSLCYARLVLRLSVNFPIKVNFEGLLCGFQDKATVAALPEVTLHRTLHEGGKTPLQILAD